jgi:hypothetical protein
MTFLNWTMLAALVAVSIPIIIHLLNRQRAVLVDWGAMRFLLESLASRRRRILLEEIILMALRCLLVALVVLALARPFLPSRAAIPWAVVLPALILAAILFGIGAAMGRAFRFGKAVLWLLSAVLVGGAILASLLEQVLQTRQWTMSGGERDVAIVLDGSRSMGLAVQGKPNFDRAVEEARSVIGALRPADTVSLIVAGPVPTPVIPKPTAARQDAAAALDGLRPPGGPMGTLEALNAAVAGLREGTNPAKLIVLVTDGQRIGWDLQNDGRWRFLASGLDALPTRPKVLVRTLALPERFHNAAMGEMAFSRPVVGTDRPVRIDAKVLNTGADPVEPTAVELRVDGEPVGRAPVGRILPGAAETVAFEHRFAKAGPHVVTAQVVAEDDFPADNSDVRVLQVVEALSVLIVEGAPTSRPLEGAAAFVALALQPRSRDADTGPPVPGPALDDIGFLVSPTVVAAPDVRTIQDLGRFAAVILADVPKLPDSFAARLEAYVEGGGGLLILPGSRAEAPFYNGWGRKAGGPVMPASLVRRVARVEEPAHLAIRTFSHPALDLLKDAGQADAESALVTAGWQLLADERSPDVRVAGRLDTGEPFLVERRLGKGYVLLGALSLDARDSSLPGLKCFVPLVHELVYYLAAPMVTRSNIQPGSEMVLELAPLRKDAGEGDLPESVDVLTPTGARRPASAALRGESPRATLPPVSFPRTPDPRPQTPPLRPQTLALRFATTWEPGLYRFLPGPDILDRYAARTAPDGGVPFAVLGEPEESRLEALSDADYEAAGQYVDLFRAKTTEELLAAVTGNVPGQELWKYLAVGLLFAVLAEVGLTRWIAVRRRLTTAAPVAFGEEILDARTFRQRVREVLKGRAEGPGMTPRA